MFSLEEFIKEQNKIIDITRLNGYKELILKIIKKHKFRKNTLENCKIFRTLV